ncbi:TonB-dependent receptor [Aureibacter tunicatorum]|uniref:TonB-dependent receptor plug domain-containing protein n=1 Tax=Aureibacter tunicatorum TaxID=866807 RepID=A0AAE3XMS9_9BACT|nr:TonB-dependent receptor plug domain-containing protein [Aureibacter tunicatorum]MDR6239463.1 hypothetical protein [Aureibacter tunicatorum]
MKFRLLFVVFIFFCSFADAQHTLLRGKVNSRSGEPVYNAHIIEGNVGLGAVSDLEGQFTLKIPEDYRQFHLTVRHINYDTLVYKGVVSEQDRGKVMRLELILEPNVEMLDNVSVVAERDVERNQVSMTEIESAQIEKFPSAFSDFNKVLATQAGVTSNNELSSNYNVRGGNFDENLVYVMGVPVYRPQLARSGQQEGLSFINPDMVNDISFSTGGWQPKYGDKLSSVLNIDYKSPEKFGGKVSGSFLGASAMLGTPLAKGKVTNILGVRYQDSRQLVKTLETQGNVFPRFVDIQNYTEIDLNSKNKGKTTLGILFGYAQNDYKIYPEQVVKSFGTVNEIKNVNLYFDGQEQMWYNTLQSGLRLSHRFSDSYKSDLIMSVAHSSERERFDVQTQYYINELSESNTDNPNEEGKEIGENYRYGRNSLEMLSYTIENRNEWEINTGQYLAFGAGAIVQSFNDEVNEYEYEENDGYGNLLNSVNAQNNLTSSQYFAYIQHTSIFDQKHVLTYGARVTYWDFSSQVLLSPRMQYSFKPAWSRDIFFKLAAGVYHQPGMYRELRGFDGQINQDVKAQTSYHIIAGMDYKLKIWDRDFRFISELYYKFLDNVIPYDIDNVRLRYYATNQAKAYAAGADFRISGEFIPGTQSWFSLGILSTKEDLLEDNRGYIRRPTDQLITLGVFFQDHIPNYPSLKVSVNYVFGSGMPFGPTGNLDLRNAFKGEEYNRLDIGFHKVFDFEEKSGGFGFSNLSLGLELLNVFGINNVVSYSWIKDINGTSFAVPNYLSDRFLNLKVSASF